MHGKNAPQESFKGTLTWILHIPLPELLLVVVVLAGSGRMHPHGNSNYSE